MEVSLILRPLPRLGLGLRSKISSPAQSFGLHRLRFFGGPLALGILFLMSAASAQGSWTNTTSASAYYQTNTNWSGGVVPSSTELADFFQSATYEVWWDGNTSPEVGWLSIGLGQVTLLNKDPSLQPLYTINGVSGWPDRIFSISGASTSATISGLHFKSLVGGQIVDGGTLNLDGSHAQGSELTIAGSRGFDVSGNLNLNAGAIIENVDAYIARNSGSAGVATVAGSGSQWNNSNNVAVGFDGNGTLKITNGGLVSSYAGYIGYSTGSAGAVTVTGSGSQWNNFGGLAVGESGSGTADILDGGVVTNDNGTLGSSLGSTGVVIVSGSDSQWNTRSQLWVGENGNGTLNVESGGVVSSTIGFIGVNSASTSTVKVTGTGSQWNNLYDLWVGNSGSGTLNILNGGVVSNKIANIGGESGSTGLATVSGSNSAWITSDDMTLGRKGNGTLSISNGGVVTNYNGTIGSDSTAAGLATVTGNGSQWNNRAALEVGYEGNGTLQVESGGVASSWAGYIGKESGSTGAVTVSGGGSEWNNSSNLYIGGSAVAVGGAGALTITDFGSVNVDLTTKLWSSGSLTLEGGRLDTGSLDNTAAGVFTFITGTLGITDAGQTLTIGESNFSLSNGTTFNTEGNPTTLSFLQTLGIAGASVIGSTDTLTLDGGFLDTGSLDNDGTIRINSAGGLTVEGAASGGGTGEIIQTAMDSVVRFLGGGSMANDMSVFGYSFGDDFTSSGAFTMMHEDSSVTVDSGATVSGSGGWGGTGGLTKKGAGQLTLTGSNSFSGGLTVEAGIVELAAVSGSAAGAVSGVSVSSGATLLLGESHQVADAAAITLSGGTLSRSSGVSETMGGLSLTAASTIDYGSGSTGTLAFGAYESGSTPDFVLTVNNFAEGNVLSLDSDLSGYLPVSYEGSAYSSTYFDINSTGGFTSAWDTNSSTFSITAVPEPSTYVAGGLLLLLIGGSFCRRRLAKVRG